MASNRTPYILLGILLLSAGLRSYGLGWGTDPRTGAFHPFHPDEATIVRSARWVGEDLGRIVAPYGKAPMYFIWAAARAAGRLEGAIEEYRRVLTLDPGNADANAVLDALLRGEAPP